MTDKKPPSLVVPSKFFAHMEEHGGNLQLAVNMDLEEEERWMVAYRHGDDIYVSNAHVGPSVTDAFTGVIRELWPPEEEEE